MKIEFVDLKARYADEKIELDRCIHKVLKKGNLVLTEELKDFETDISSFTNTRYCLGLNSGTDALMMSLWANNIGKNDEIITSSKSFIASIGAIVHVGAKPKLIDIDDDMNMDVNLIEKSISKKTKAIMPVHWTGRICDMNKIKKIAKKYNLKVIEDAAQAMGSYFCEKHAGNFGDVSAFSCHPLKNLNALGDGGFITTNNRSIYEKVKLYRNHGLYKRDDVRIFGVNSRLDSLNAVVLSMRLKKLKKIIKKRRKNIELYRQRLECNDFISLPYDKKNEYSSYVMFVAKCKKRDNLHKYLANKGIQSMIYYGTPLHKHLASKNINLDTGSLKKSELICKQVLALPHHQYLKENEIDYVCENINKFYKTI